MVKTMKRTRFALMYAVAICAAAFCADIVQGVEINSDTTVTVSADSGTDYEIAAGVTLTFSVASGGSYTLSGAITGAGAVRKEGAGELKLSNSANSFSGGMYNNQGKLRATASGAFGTGGITNKCPAYVIFDASNGVFPNSIWLTGSDVDSGDVSPSNIQFVKDTELQGGIGGDVNVMIANHITSGSGPTGARGPRVSINGDVKIASGKKFRLFTYGVNTFNGAIDASGMNGNAYFGYNWSNGGMVELASPRSVWKNGVRNRSNVLSCLADNVVSNAMLHWDYPTTGTNPNGQYLSSIKLNGHSQRIRSLNGGDSYVLANKDAANGYMIMSSSPATLTILGESTSRKTACRIQDEITVVLDAAGYPNFVQMITNRTCTTKGDLIISNGTLRLSGSTSFPNVPNLTIGAGGTLDLKTDVMLSLASVTNFVLEGKFLAATSSSCGLSGNQVDLTFGDNAEFYLKEDEVFMVKSLKIGADSVAPDRYVAPDARLPQLKSGTLIVPKDDVPSSASWTGGADTDDISLAANWSDPNASTVEGTMDAIFASAGDHAIVQGTASLANLTFTSAPGSSGFTFDASGDAAMLESFGNSISFTGPATNVFNVPVRISQAQNWTFIGSPVIRFTEDFYSTVGTISMSGAGDLFFCKPVESSYGFDVSQNTRVHVCGTTFTLNGFANLPEPSNGGIHTFTLNGNNSTQLVLSNATVRMPVYMATTVLGSAPIVAAPASTNTFMGRIDLNSSYSGFDIPEGSEIILKGGFKSTGASPRMTKTAGTVRIKDVPVSAIYALGWNQQNGKLIVETPNNSFLYLTTGHLPVANDKPVIDLRVSQAVTNGCMVNAPRYENNKNFVPCTTSGYKAMIEFNATTQRVDSLVGYPRGTFHGAEGSLIEVTKQVRTGFVDLLEKDFYVASEISGYLSLKMAGTGDLVLTNRAFSSTGNLEVVSGTLTMRENATWLNGSNVTVRGTGTLRLDAGGRFGKHVSFHLGADGDSWSIAMPNGGSQRVACLYDVDGRSLPSGIYGAAGVDGVTQTRYSAHFTGAGVLKVGRFGTRIILR